MSEEKIADLESRLAFQEQAINDLSDTVYRQEKTILALEKRLSSLSGKLTDMADSIADDGPQHQPPPHY